jgi:hypothetical protein
MASVDGHISAGDRAGMVEWKRLRATCKRRAQAHPMTMLGMVLGGGYFVVGWGLFGTPGALAGIGITAALTAWLQADIARELLVATVEELTRR